MQSIDSASLVSKFPSDGIKFVGRMSEGQLLIALVITRQHFALNAVVN